MNWFQTIKCTLGLHEWDNSKIKKDVVRFPKSDFINEVIICFETPCKFCDKKEKIAGCHLERVEN